ncbi:ABC transporter substrate-binding protein [Martelella radicis]|uniref:Multiple sugar transport system substrate-binding protein n=1 Tax=Martelella radicis TaxID=1397476 RepID=A0A7W6KNN5_9HYPH|nr:ABC transporter substrate-binding protein [Martelella radicis]MBB4123200.1 multiple sugar transport system substrate-binding protein [Martelella radicis]
MMVFKASVAALALSVSAFGAHAADGKVTFLNWITAEPSNAPVMTQLIEETGVPVDVLSSAWGDMQKTVFLRIRTGQPLDVYQAQERWLPTFAQMPDVVDFNELYGEEKLAAMFPPEVLAAGQVKGKQVGMPWNIGSISLVSNRKVLEQAGVSEPPATIDDFVADLEKVKEAQPNSTPYAMMTKGDDLVSSDFQLWLWAFGGSIFDENGQPVVDSEATVQTLDFMKDLVDSGLSALDVDRGAARRMFGQGESAYYFDAPVAKGFAEDFSGEGEAFVKYVYPVPMPVAEAGMTPHSMEWGHLLVMRETEEGMVDGALSAESPSAKLISGLTMNDEIQLEYFQKLGAIPVTKSARASDIVTSDQYIVDWNASLGMPKLNELASLKDSANYVAIVSEEVQSAVLGKKDSATAAADMQSRIEKLMN